MFEQCIDNKNLIDQIKLIHYQMWFSKSEKQSYHSQCTVSKKSFILFEAYNCGSFPPRLPVEKDNGDSVQLGNVICHSMLSYISFDIQSRCVHSLCHDEDTYTHLLRTISIGTPGFTIAIFIHSLPRSTDMTATLTTNTKTHATWSWRGRGITPEILRFNRAALLMQSLSNNCCMSSLWQCCKTILGWQPCSSLHSVLHVRKMCLNKLILPVWEGNIARTRQKRVISASFLSPMMS